MKNIVITGAYGFIGSNLCLRLEEIGEFNVLKIGRNSTTEELKEALSIADFVYHLAGVNRPVDDEDFQTGNHALTSFIVSELKRYQKHIPLMLSSSIQAEQDNAYGISKSMAENVVMEYAYSTNSNAYVYRFPNVFGKWCRPNYNSFVATFCHNIINDLSITVNDPSSLVTLLYIDDLCDDLISLLLKERKAGLQHISTEYITTVGEVAELLRSFKESRNSLIMENVGSGLSRALYSTYLSYLSPSQFSYTIPSYGDDRGVFSEMLKTRDAGQVSFFTAHPGITRGGHYHHTKNEKFLVIKGAALFRFENMQTGELHTLEVSSDVLQVVETVPGWSHDVTNTGSDELIVMLWANEVFDRSAPDTITKLLSK